jgi:hypothetical protein
MRATFVAPFGVGSAAVIGTGQALALATALAGATGPNVHIEVAPTKRGPVTLYGVELSATPGRFAQGVHRERWVACESPCDRVVDMSRGSAFQIGGPTTTRSRSFTLPPEGTARVVVKAGRKGAFVAGWVLSCLGGAGLVAGVGTMVFADNDNTLLTAGGITLGASLPLIIAGAVLVATSRTRVSVRPGP